MESEELKDFLFKLDDRTREELSKIMQDYDLDKTKATRHAVENYSRMRGERDQFKERALKAEKELYVLKTEVTNFLNAQLALTKSI
jgi:hypothetical protein